MEIKLWRIKSFPIPPRLRELVLSLFIFIFVFTVGLIAPFGDFERSKQFVLQDPYNPSAHLALARAAAEASDWDLGRREFAIAASLSSSPSHQNVLGLTSQFEDVWSHVYQEQRIREKIGVWEEILSKQPGYRDGYLQLAVLSYQLSDDQSSLRYWLCARDLDPNNSTVAQVGALFQQGHN